MRILTYRDGPFIDREKEESYILERFYKERPENILFVYGPKSSGKTTLLEYIVEEKLQKDERFYVNYVNFRRYAIVNYDSFLNVYFKPITEENKPFLAKMVDVFKVAIAGLKGEISIPEKGINFMVSYNLYEAMENKKIDPFDLFFDVLRNIKSEGKTPILIIDEVQELKDIYMNGEEKKRYLLTEFFKFLVGLTKETHLAHIIISTSSSIFIDYIYNHSNLLKTNKLYLIDHFDYKTTKEWLKMESFSDDEIELIWEYIGGCPFDIISLIEERRISDFDLKKYLQREANIMSSRIGITVAKEFETRQEKRYFKQLLKEMVQKGYIIKDDENELQNKVIEKATEKDFLFIKADENRVIFNSQIVRKGAEIYTQNI